MGYLPPHRGACPPYVASCLHNISKHCRIGGGAQRPEYNTARGERKPFKGYTSDKNSLTSSPLDRKVGIALYGGGSDGGGGGW